MKYTLEKSVLLFLVILGLSIPGISLSKEVYLDKQTYKLVKDIVELSEDDSENIKAIEMLESRSFISNENLQEILKAACDTLDKLYYKAEDKDDWLNKNKDLVTRLRNCCAKFKYEINTRSPRAPLVADNIDAPPEKKVCECEALLPRDATFRNLCVDDSLDHVPLVFLT